MPKNEYFPLDSCSIVSSNIILRIEFPFSSAKIDLSCLYPLFWVRNPLSFELPSDTYYSISSRFLSRFFLCFLVFRSIYFMLHFHENFRLIPFGLISALWISRFVSFTKFEKLSAIISSNTASVPLSSLSFSVIPIKWILIIIPQIMRFWGFSFVWEEGRGGPFSLFCSDWVNLLISLQVYWYYLLSHPVFWANQGFIFLILKNSVLSFPFRTFYNYFLAKKILFL